MIQVTRYNFLKYRFVAAFISLSIIGAFVATCFYKQRTQGSVFSYSIDFTGGTQVLLRFSEKVCPVFIKAVVEKAGWTGAITRVFSPQEILVRVKEVETDAKGLGGRIREAVTVACRKDISPDIQVEILQSETVGGGIGEELRWKSFRAVLVALLAMLLYISFSFWSFAFAMGAVVALFHDALLMLASFLFFNREISSNIIAAILTVLGYSINDTIVIFAQIRQNIKKMHGVPLRDVVNISINQTLRRTLLTSFSTALTVGSIFILGGETLRDFSFAMLVGIVVGTFSSIYIASPVMMLLYKEK